MLEIGAGVGSNTSIDMDRVAEPIPKTIQMVNGHDTQGDPPQVLLPWHPVRDTAHIDGGQDRGSDLISLQQRFGSPY